MGEILITVYDTGHATSQRICRVFALGAKAKIVEGFDTPLDDENAVFCYGVMRGNSRLIARCKNRDWYLCDNGYLRAGHFDGYYRITKNAFLCSGDGDGDFDRLDRLKIEIAPWRKSGRYILLCVPPPLYCKAWKFDGKAWRKRIMETLKGATDRPVVLSFKPGLDERCPPDQAPLAEQLKDAWAVVTHDSNVAIDALIAGVQVFVTGDTPARRCGLTDVSRIEEPIYPDDRRELLSVLAANQWTLDEFRDGTAARMLGIVGHRGGE